MSSIQDILLATAKIEVQIILALLHSVLWYVLINYVLFAIARKIICNMRSKKQFLHQTCESMKKMVGDAWEDEESQIELAANTQCILVQHCVGGMLSLPSVLGMSYLFPAGVTAAMARHGALCEIGFEIQDTLLRTWQIVFGGEIGRKRNPLSMMVIQLMHHSLAFCLVIPLNIYYPDNVWYHEGIVLPLLIFDMLQMNPFGIL